MTEIVWLEFKFAYHDVAVKYISHYASRNPNPGKKYTLYGLWFIKDCFNFHLKFTISSNTWLSQKFWNILVVRSRLWSVCHVNNEAALMNNKSSLIREHLLYEFEVDFNAAEASKKIGVTQREDAVDHSTLSRWFKKFHLSCKNVDDQVNLGRLKNVNVQPVLQAIEAE